MSFAAEPLTHDHELAGFACGKPELDRWLSQHSLLARAQGTRTYILVRPPSRVVHGYFAIAPHLIRRDDLAPAFGRGMTHRVPAILLAKLALAQELQGQGFGTKLLKNALETIVTAARGAGGKLVVVDAVDKDAAAFYVAHDFVPLPLDEPRLVLKLSTAARELGLDWP